MGFTKKIIIDLWKTSAHGIELGFKKEDVLRAKSRQFTKDTDIIGEVKEKGDTIGYVSYREDPWKEDIPNKRLIIKHFTKGMNWKGSMEEMLGRGVSQSLAADKGIPAFVINLQNNKHLIKLERVQRHGSFNKKIYSFVIVDDDDYEVSLYYIQEDRLTLGSDWDVYDRAGKKIAKIDGAKFNVGGKYDLELDEDSPFFRKELDEVLILFCTFLRFAKETEKKLEKTMKILKDPAVEFKIRKNEADLYKNPRLLRV